MNCPKCGEEMRWLSDHQDEETISHFYDCSVCEIDCIKTTGEEFILNN